MPDRNDVERLKTSWYIDPCWDLEETEGFEDYRQELYTFRKQCEYSWEQAYLETLRQKAKELGVPGKIKLAEYVIRLEKQIENLQKRVDQLND